MFKGLAIVSALLMNAISVFGQEGMSIQKDNPDELALSDSIGILGTEKNQAFIDSLVQRFDLEKQTYTMPIITLEPTDPMPTFEITKPDVQYYILNSMGPDHYVKPGSANFRVIPNEKRREK